MYLKIHYLYSFYLSLIVFCAVVDSNDHGYQYVSNEVITPERYVITRTLLFRCIKYKSCLSNN